MVLGRFDFYHEKYWTISAQLDIIKIAIDLFGDELRQKAKAVDVRDKWLLNVSKYLDALHEEETEYMKLPTSKNEGPVDYNQVLAEVLEIQKTEDADMERGNELDNQLEEEEEEEDYNCSDDDERLLLHPRSYRFFYGKLLRSMRLWKRPPHNHCERCAEYEQKANRVNELTVALVSTSGSVEFEQHAKVVARAGGSVKAWEELRSLQRKMPDLKKHVEWNQTARAYLKKWEQSMPITTVMWQLDYGGLQDSANKKVSVWSATIISSPATGRKQEHYDFFFDQAPSKLADPVGTAKKDGLTGKYLLGDMLDKENSPNSDGVSLFATDYPDITDIVLSGDTGNGYRAYAMLEFLSKVFNEYAYKVKLIPLAPGHAWNLTDARIAHMNTFLNAILKKSRVLGALGIAAAFRAASDPRLHKQRKFMARSHIFFVKVKVDRPKAAEEKKLLGAQVDSEWLDGGKMGVRGFLYFDFSVIGPDKQPTYMPGYARTREHADPGRPDNRTYVWTWRKDLTTTICQRCSDEWGGPVLLTANGCTKKRCAIAAALAQKEAKEEDERRLPGIPLQRGRQLPEGQQLPEDVGQAKQSKKNKNKKSTTSIESRPDPRQVRVVHGEAAGGIMEIWLYVPENRRDKSGTKRKGWCDAPRTDR